MRACFTRGVGCGVTSTSTPICPAPKGITNVADILCELRLILELAVANKAFVAFLAFAALSGIGLLCL